MNPEFGFNEVGERVALFWDAEFDAPEQEPAALEPQVLVESLLWLERAGKPEYIARRLAILRRFLAGGSALAEIGSAAGGISAPRVHTLVREYQAAMRGARARPAPARGGLMLPHLVKAAPSSVPKFSHPPTPATMSKPTKTIPSVVTEFFAALTSLPTGIILAPSEVSEVAALAAAHKSACADLDACSPQEVKRRFNDLESKYLRGEIPIDELIDAETDGGASSVMVSAVRKSPRVNSLAREAARRKVEGSAMEQAACAVRIMEREVGRYAAAIEAVSAFRGQLAPFGLGIESPALARCTQQHNALVAQINHLGPIVSGSRVTATVYSAEMYLRGVDMSGTFQLPAEPKAAA